MKKSIMLLLILLLFSSCLQQNIPMTQTRKIPLFFAKSSDIDVAAATCRVTADDMDTIQTALTVNPTEITGNIPEVPYGDDRLFEIFCYSTGGTLNYYGSVVADIKSTAPVVNIVLYPYDNTADVTIIGTFGDPDVDLDLGLIAYYPFNDNVYDLSPSENHCYDLSDSTYVDGINGKAKYFNGIDDMLKLSNSLDVSNGLTFSFWLKSEGVREDNENGVVIAKYDMTTWGRCMMLNTQESWTTNNPSLRLNLYPSPYSSDDADAVYSDLVSAEDLPGGRDSLDFTSINPMKLPLNEWVHCVVNVTDSTMEAWISGTLTVVTKRANSVYNNGSQYYGTDVDMYIGNCPNAGEGSNNHYRGSIDEMRIYDRPLTIAEINYLYENQK